MADESALRRSQPGILYHGLGSKLPPTKKTIAKNTNDNEKQLDDSQSNMSEQGEPVVDDNNPSNRDDLHEGDPEIPPVIPSDADRLNDLEANVVTICGTLSTLTTAVNNLSEKISKKENNEKSKQKSNKENKTKSRISQSHNNESRKKRKYKES